MLLFAMLSLLRGNNDDSKNDDLTMENSNAALLKEKESFLVLLKNEDTKLRNEDADLKNEDADLKNENTYLEVPLSFDIESQKFDNKTLVGSKNQKVSCSLFLILTLATFVVLWIAHKY